MKSISRLLRVAFLNYFRNLKYLLLIAGVVHISFIAVVLFIFLRFRGVLGDGFLDVGRELLELFYASVSGVNLETFLRGNFFTVMLENLRETLTDRYYVTLGSLITMLIVSVVFILLSFKLAGFLCKFFMRKEKKEKDTRKGIFAILIRFLVSIAFTFIFTVSIVFFFHSIYILIILYLAVKAIENIVEIKLIYFKDKRVGELLKFKNIMLSILSNIIFFLMTVSVVLFIGFVWDFFWAIIIVIPLFIYYAEIVKFTMIEYFRKEFEAAKRKDILF